MAGAPFGTKDAVDVLLDVTTSEGDCTALLDVEEAGVWEWEEREDRFELLDFARGTTWELGCDAALGANGLVKVKVKNRWSSSVHMEMIMRHVDWEPGLFRLLFRDRSR